MVIEFIFVCRFSRKWLQFNPKEIELKFLHGKNFYSNRFIFRSVNNLPFHCIVPQL